MTKVKIDPSKLTIEKFNEILDAHMDAILASTPEVSIISKDDEWNDPEYDEFADKIMKRLNNEIEEKK